MIFEEILRRPKTKAPWKDPSDRYPPGSFIPNGHCELSLFLICLIIFILATRHAWDSGSYRVESSFDMEVFRRYGNSSIMGVVTIWQDAMSRAGVLMHDGSMDREQLLTELRELRGRVEELKSENTTLKKQRQETDGLSSSTAFHTQDRDEDYRSVMETASEAICIAQDELVKFVNPAGTQLTGYSKEELISTPFAFLAHPGDREALRLMYLVRIQGEYAPPSHRFRIVGKGGEVKWVDSSSARIEWKGRTAVLSIMREVTPEVQEDEPMQRAHDELDLRALESEESYCRILQTVNEGIWALDREFRTRCVNGRMVDMLGYSEQEMRGKGVDSFSFEEDLQDHQTRMERLSKGEGGRYERRFRRKDGDPLWTIVSATALKDSDGKFAGSLAMLTDITEVQKTLEALRESEEKYRLLFSKETDAIALIDGESQVFLDVNEAFLRLYGYRQEEILGSNATIVSAEPEKTKASLQVGMDPLGSTIPLRWHKRKDGAVFPVEISVNPITFKGRPAAYAIVRDITQRKRAEDLILAQRGLSVALSAISSLDKACETCLDTALHISGMEAGAVYVVGEDMALDLAAHKGLGKEFLDQGKHLAKDVPETKMLLSGSAVYSSRSLPEIAPFMNGSLRNKGFLSSAAIPIVHQNRVICSLHLFSLKLEEVPGDMRIALEAIAAQIGGAVSRIEAEELARERQHTIEALLNATTDGFLLFDRQRKFLLCNQTVASHAKMEVGELVGKKLSDVESREVATSREKRLDEVFRTGKPLRFQDEREGRCFENVVTPLLGHGSEVSAVAVYVQRHH